MKNLTIQGIFFSPTGTTKTIVKNIAAGFGAHHTEMIDITQRADRDEHLEVHADIVILAAPVYYGRIPEEITSYFSSLKARQTPVVPVVVYGNREYDDALLELCDLAVEADFALLAGGVFVAEHSYSPLYPIAKDRPDAKDLLKAAEFGMQIREKYDKVATTKTRSISGIPGNRPYIEPTNLNMIKEARKVVQFTPETDDDSCTKCGGCVESCPTDAIAVDMSHTDKWQCLLCFACVKCCPTGARKMTDPNFNQAIKKLYEMTQTRKEPELFF
jgi:ferredoxin/flavodoxin